MSEVERFYVSSCGNHSCDPLLIEPDGEYVYYDEYAKLKAENESLRRAIVDAEYRADQGKVWNGMGWSYIGLSAHAQQKVLDILRAAISSPENPS